jgi:hypothetical protein
VVGGVVLREGVAVVGAEGLVGAGELSQGGFEGLEVLRAELREGGEGVVDAEEGGGVVGDFEVGGALRDELGGCQCAVLCCGALRCVVESARVVFGGRTAAGSSSRSMLAVVFFLRSLRESSVRALLGGRDFVYGSLLGSCRLVSRDAALVLGFGLLLWRPCAHGNGGRTAAAAPATLSRARGGRGAYVTDGFHETALTVHLPVLSILVNPYLRVAAASPRLCTSALSNTTSHHVAVATM